MSLEAALWDDVVGDELVAFLEDLNRQLESPLPASVIVHRRGLACYPRHALYRIRLPVGDPPRESYLLYAPGDAHPLDWTSTPVHDLNERALRIRDESTAEVYLRFFCWAIAGDEGRFFISEELDDLPLLPDAELEPPLRERLTEALAPMEAVPSESDDPAGSYRFTAPVLYGTALFEATFLVHSGGETVMVDDEPVAADLPVHPDRITSDRYFVLKQAGGLGMLPDEFLEKLLAGERIGAGEDGGKDGAIRYRVLGRVDARGLTFRHPVEIEDVRFNGDVSFEGARFRCPVRLERCRFGGRLDLTEARVEGSFTGRGLRFGEASLPGPDDEPVLRARALRVAGSLALEGLRVKGKVDLSRIRVESDVRLGAVLIENPGASGWDPDAPFIDALVLRGAQIRGNLDFYFAPGGHFFDSVPRDPDLAARIPANRMSLSVVQGSIVASNARIDGELLLGGLRCHQGVWFDLCEIRGGISGDATERGSRVVVCGDLVFTHCRIRGTVSLSGVWVGRGLYLYGSTILGSVFIRTGLLGAGVRRHAHIGGQLDLSGIRVEDVDLEGIEIGHLRMITGEIDRLKVVPGIEAAPREADAPDDRPVLWRLRSSRIGRLAIQSASFGRGLSIVGTDVGAGAGDDAPADGAGAAGGGVPDEPEGRPPAAEILFCTCGANVFFWSRTLYESLSDPPAPHEWEGGAPPPLHEVVTRFPGDLDLRSLKVRDHLSLANARVGGRILLRDANVGLDIDMSSHAGDPEVKTGTTRTTCSGLELEAATCRGDADFTGLVVREAPGRPGSVLARRFRVAGKLLFSAPLGPEPHDYDAIPDDPKKRSDASIFGFLDLSTAEASHLVLSGHGFEEPKSARGISFERGRFDRFQIVDPLPRAYDLSNVSVERWEIPQIHLVPFLDGAKPFQRSTYLALEQSLRNDGDDALADEIYRRMRRKEMDEGDGESAGRRGIGYRVARSARRAWSGFLGLTTGWGTQSVRPLLLGLLLFPLSAAIFSSPVNVEPSERARAAAAAAVTLGEPPPVLDPGRQSPGWGLDDGLWMALRYHVPVIPLEARGDFVAARSAARLPLPGGSRLRMPISAEDYAFLIYLLHWILWPLFLLGVTSRAIRTRA